MMRQIICMAIVPDNKLMDPFRNQEPAQIAAMIHSKTKIKTTRPNFTTCLYLSRRRRARYRSMATVAMFSSETTPMKVDILAYVMATVQ